MNTFLETMLAVTNLHFNEVYIFWEHAQAALASSSFFLCFCFSFLRKEAEESKPDFHEQVIVASLTFNISSIA